MRPLLLQLAFMTDKHSSTISHAYAMLHLQRAQLKSLVAASKASETPEVHLMQYLYALLERLLYTTHLPESQNLYRNLKTCGSVMPLQIHKSLTLPCHWINVVEQVLLWCLIFHLTNRGQVKAEGGTAESRPKALVRRAEGSKASSPGTASS